MFSLLNFQTIFYLFTFIPYLFFSLFNFLFLPSVNSQTKPNIAYCNPKRQNSPLHCISICTQSLHTLSTPSTQKPRPRLPQIFKPNDGRRLSLLPVLAALHRVRDIGRHHLPLRDLRFPSPLRLLRRRSGLPSLQRSDLFYFLLCGFRIIWEFVKFMKLKWPLNENWAD